MENHRGNDQATSLREEVQKEAEQLPSRSELYAHKRNNKPKWRVKFPFVKLVGILFLLIPVSILVIYFNNDDSDIIGKLFTPSLKNVESISMPTAVSANTINQKNESTANTGQTNSDTPKKEIVNTDVNNQSESKKSPVSDNQPDTATTPVTNAEEEVESNEIEEQPEEETYIEHIVQENETLFRISMKYFNSRDGELIISNYNNLINDQVIVGQKLIIPVNN
ncbi:LysM peptidoglycan-binding domain-containing protein [Sutcliffiella rhizosphaerae]|uniref:LysM domain-containing protein n=1 Tax=Sutcliffiella rhizosphaerae TaxID=2880967 RepID=A0ABM8YU48_9BACI|nr:LysM peptidoglycan-binding domain-containing protein [Sutcliffiella rhizosphaerae]CAG9623502.1 hypothetical protein BACCIP111883_04315 [Sutcliffiella rhizosphaerae]